MTFNFGDTPNTNLTYLDASGIPDIERELLSQNNLSDVENVVQARNNLGVSASGVGSINGSGLLPANNLSDLDNITTARENIDVYQKSDFPISGLTNPSLYDISYNSTNRQFSITNNGTKVATNGVVNTPTNETTSAHADTTDEYWVVYESGNSSATVKTIPDIGSEAIVDRIYYLATADGGPDYLDFEERHSTEWSASLHENMHETIGAKIVTNPLGCDIADYTLDSDADSDMQFSLSAGEMYDEDIEHQITAVVGGTYTVVYRDGLDTDEIMLWSDTETQPYTAGTYIHYNQLSGGSWTRTELTNGQYMNLWVLTWTRKDHATDVFVHLGQEVYDTIDGALDETLGDLSLALHAPEQVPLYKITVNTSSSYNSTGKVEFSSIEDLRGRFTGSAIGNSIQTLGTMSLQNADNVDINGGSITGITDLAIADGGTGASTASGARTNLGLGNMSIQDAANVNISGGNIDGVNIGTKSAGFISSTGVNITGNANFPLTHLADASGINTNCASGNNFVVTLGGNRTLLNPTSLNEGVYNWVVKQDGTGSRTLAFGDKFQFIPSGAPTLSTSANAIDVISGIYDNQSDYMICSYVLWE